ncbi:mitochondrial protein C2orf69 homolog [Palaemon carinicauda]|uniref:mitochondrial protein C2orf69 homolog n=1 Tax=Palaemon carinicauda TaxID=392227 RepID=UPI0035B5F781
MIISYEIFIFSYIVRIVRPLDLEDGNSCRRLSVYSLHAIRNMCACKVLGQGSMIRLGFVVAQSGLKNELIYVPPSAPQETKHPVLAFFGGDVQDYPEVMEAHRDNKRYVEWSLTGTASLLASKFPSHHILVVKPSRMERKTFSCYDNFVTSNSVGAPTHSPGTGAIIHLNDLISEGLKSAREKSEDHCMFPESVDDITLIGFSKGCVILNQLITEFHTVKTSNDQEQSVPLDFIQKISNMYWLDGGHAGGSKTWITESSVLNTLASLNHIKIHVHVSPYQVEDEQRPWIRRECKSFCKILQRSGCKINYKLHFEEEERSLFSHFKILNEFS